MDLLKGSFRRRIAFPEYRRDTVCDDWEREHLNEPRERL
jgi:hypothetical protein